MQELNQALQAHEHSDRILDVVETVGISICAIGIIASALMLAYVALLLRAAVNTLASDIRRLLSEVALHKVRLEEIDFRLGIDRQSGENADANRP